MRQLKDVIHYYLGCEVKCKSEVIPTPRGKTMLTGIDAGWTGSTMINVRVENKDRQYIFTLDEVKPILRHLEDMTGEHSKEAVQVVGYTPDEMTAKHFRKRLKEWGLHICQFVPLINYLRSKGYDCDGLIESGEAIDAKTLNEKK